MEELIADLSKSRVDKDGIFSENDDCFEQGRRAAKIETIKNLYLEIYKHESFSEKHDDLIARLDDLKYESTRWFAWITIGFNVTRDAYKIDEDMVQVREKLENKSWLTVQKGC